MIPKLIYKNDKHQRKNFYASDCLKLEADIILELQGVEVTNPPTYGDALKWRAGKAIEESLVEVLKANGHISEEYNQEGESVKIEREGITVSMHFDALTKESDMNVDDNILPNSKVLHLEEGCPLEIKSINNKNSFDINDYINGNPKENYVMQLSIYMDALSKDVGYLFVASIDGLNIFFFECRKTGEGKYKCGNVEVDINAEYKRWSGIWKKFKAPERLAVIQNSLKVLSEMLPNFSITAESKASLEKLEKEFEVNWKEEIYKLPIESIDWTKLSTNAIGEARNNRKVIGSENSWKLLYSPFSKLILEKQGIKTRGYSDEELAKIAEITAGFTTWNKKPKVAVEAKAKEE